jgi:CheY-like chemotaxis protein
MHEVYLQNLSRELLGGNESEQGLVITHFPFVMGRQRDCDHRIENPFVSRRHCSLFLQEGAVWVQDLGSYNGTYVNHDRLEHARPLRDGDTLQVAFIPFRVRLPARPEAPPVEPADEVKAMALVREPHRVLVVEDNEDAAETLALVLKAWGHDVVVAHDGPEAIQAACAHRPDTVLLDIRLPGMDGYQVAQRLRTEAGLNKAHLVGITGYPDEQDQPRVKEVGLDQVLTKPVPPETLQEVVARTS